LQQLLDSRRIVQCLKHQSGSRYIQDHLLPEASPAMMSAILKHVIFEEEELVALSEDIFGNYVVQMFFERARQCHAAQSGQWMRWFVERLLRGNAYRLSRHIYGCRVIQRALECISSAERVRLVDEIESEGRALAASGRTLLEETILCHHGNHVIQKIITLGLPLQRIQFVVDTVARDIPLYSQHQYGCRIVQNIVNLYGYEGRKRVLREVVKRDNLLALCRSQYGNYVIQHVLKLTAKSWSHCPAEYRGDHCLAIKDEVIRIVFGNVVALSHNKYGSNVVEKCLSRATGQQIDLLLDRILAPKPGRGGQHDPSKTLRGMMNDQFANYVIQNVIRECSGRHRQRMVAFIEEHVPNLRAMKYGKHILEKINRARSGARF